MHPCTQPHKLNGPAALPRLSSYQLAIQGCSEFSPVSSLDMANPSGRRSVGIIARSISIEVAPAERHMLPQRPVMH